VRPPVRSPTIHRTRQVNCRGIGFAVPGRVPSPEWRAAEGASWSSSGSRRSSATDAEAQARRKLAPGGLPAGAETVRKPMS